MALKNARRSKIHSNLSALNASLTGERIDGLALETQLGLEPRDILKPWGRA